ncbi:unnamed protein product [Adineta steineri]|uniref:Uncharacterized protein n=1 Tax=Adineta steineri TaxID=433720 RepID=A0A819RVI7_9BILA|nr:unnamed protein product [Adineta steineri]CAF4043861.1 unnamed protein product [Adineta steineri]
MMEFNILPPNIVIRTSDYIQEIIQFIKKSIQTGDAYEFNSMVYSKECEDLKCDIHSGGCGDLHASSKNYCGNKSWVNYELGDGATGEHESTKFSNEFMEQGSAWDGRIPSHPVPSHPMESHGTFFRKLCPMGSYGTASF